MTSRDDRALMHGPADPPPTPVCETCGSDDLIYYGGNHCFCWGCRDNRTVTSEGDYLAKHPEDLVEGNS